MISAYCSAAGQDIRILLANHASMIAVYAIPNALDCDVYWLNASALPMRGGYSRSAGALASHAHYHISLPARNIARRLVRDARIPFQLSSMTYTFAQRWVTHQLAKTHSGCIGTICIQRL